MKHILSLLGAACLFVSVSVWAQAPAQIGFQGLLTQDGAPIDGTVSLTFSLYDAPGAATPLWTEVHPAVIVDQGHYNVILGSINSFLDAPPQGYGFDFDRPLYLGITVGSDPELTPRSLLLSAPSAMTLATPAVLDAPLSSGPNKGGWALRVSNTDPNGSFAIKAYMPHRGYAVFATTPGPAPAVYAGGGPTGLVAAAQSDGSDGSTGLYAHNQAPGGGNGMLGVVDNSPGTAVAGFAPAQTGQTVGVGGLTVSPDGIGVSASGATGLYAEGQTAIIANGFGVGMEVSAPQIGIQAVGRDVAVLAIDSSETLEGTVGVWSKTFSPTGIGVYARALAFRNDQWNLRPIRFSRGPWRNRIGRLRERSQLWCPWNH